jgi:hypothetical protein
MKIRYRSPANPGETLSAEARVEARRRRIYHVRGEVHGADGRLVAEAEGRFLGASPSAKADLKARYAAPATSSAPADATETTQPTPELEKTAVR